MPGHPDPADLNAAFWREGSVVGAYDRRDLSPAEIRLLLRYRAPLEGRVLELGPGAGRLTLYLADLASELTAFEISPAMAEACRRRVPSARVEVRDLQDVGALGDATLDAVVAGCNVLDVLGDPQRRTVLRELRRVLTPDGVLLFSSHNRDSPPRRPWQPRTLRRLRPLVADVVRLPASVRNRRRLAPLEREEDGYALRNDEAHAFTMLHYNITAPAQRAQLADAGFALELCLTEAGDEVQVGRETRTEPYLHYAARAQRPTR